MSSPTSISKTTTSHSIPLVYRLFHLYMEPFSAIVGAAQSLFTTPSYLSIITQPNVYVSGAPLTSLNHLLLAQVAGLYVLLGVVELAVLRPSRDLRVWRGVIMAISFSDVGHLYAAWVGQGGLERTGGVFWDPRLWRGEEWVNLGLTWFGFFLRLAFLAGVGMGGVKEERKRE
ncbi:uncharacterized protein BDZ99DRAFT_378275 [Mytilinidion resinicola]|uniref:DUF7704 domain-containing protein n=1 Tax=Mytilinidion resinicola TaxID=574789 RepID=A0A6A6Z067_9PEZI|nr:uncharacterized protein BDZ99DRAFT_378275 [Mytilinidion resinicola]KAF2814576.1 hypothetical protein BDZ99DRAFT_378275 [Mytilinidion resinicola]